jgi:hypothetical protein
MNGLLDDPAQAGLLSMGLRLLSTPGKFGQAFGQAGLGAMGDIQQAKAAQDVKRTRALQEQMQMMQLQQIKAQQERQAQEAAKEQAREGAYRGAIESPATQALAGGGGPTVGNAQAMAGLKPRVNQDKLIQGLLQADPMAAYQMMQPKPDELMTVAPGATVLNKSDPTRPLFTAPKESAAPSAVQEYQFAKDQGYRGDFTQWKRDNAQAGASRVNVSTPFENSFSKASGTGFAKAYEDINTNGMQASQTIANLDRMEQLLQGVTGGRLAPAGKEIASVAESFGVKVDPKLGNKEAAEALSVEMALAMRPPGSGPMTDRDFANFLLTVPGLSKTAEGRAQITQTLRAKAQRDIKMAELAQRYVERNGVLDTGFYKVAQEFIGANPVVNQPSVGGLTPSESQELEQLRARFNRGK